MALVADLHHFGLHDHGGPSRKNFDGGRRRLRIGFVNNMPDAAFEETHRQFSALICASSPRSAPELSCYYLPTVSRSADVLKKASAPYRDVAAMLGDPPDALVITGTEPRALDLTAEPYWETLAGLLRWAYIAVPSTLLSCLASHAAALALDGIDRSPLPLKQSGVYQHRVDVTHPLAHGLGAVVGFPHSRLNEIPASSLKAHRYRLMISSVNTGWTVATRETEGRLMTLLQGHPEYTSTTLLKEHRRDVRRYLEGSRATYPEPPVGYLDRGGMDLLVAFRKRCEGLSGASGADFPYDKVVGHIRAGWDRGSRRLFANWMADVRQRSAAIAA